MKAVTPVPVFVGLWLLAAAHPALAAPCTITVRETAGIRRFGYPVTAVCPLTSAEQSSGHFRLLQAGKPVSAQFTPFPERNVVEVDFAVSLAPGEQRTYHLEWRPGNAESASKDGMTVETQADALHIRNGHELEFIVPRYLLGFLRQVKVPAFGYLGSGTGGLWIQYKDAIGFRAGGKGPEGEPTRVQVVKAGPWVAKLRFESTEPLRGGRKVASVVEMEFPRTKSWVQVDWTVADPNGFIAGLGAEVPLHLNEAPVLVDFGAGSLVYTPLMRGQSALLRGSSQSWAVDTGPWNERTPYVVGPAGQRAEGWAHVMDDQRCTALAIDRFGQHRRNDTIEVTPDRRLTFTKTFPLADGVKHLTFWLHFVTMPVHVGAATSPQSMLAPLAVEVGK